MTETNSPDSGSGTLSPSPQQAPQPIIIQQVPAGGFFRRLLVPALVMSLLLNFATLSSLQTYTSETRGPREKFHSGDQYATDRIARIEINGTISPPFTERLLKSIKAAEEDDNVKGVLLIVDSPGGLVADSHQIYHRLSELREKKPVTVSMKRMAASGGLYVAMGAGPDGTIFAEPTTWTGSIGVIIPRYDASQLAEKLGISSEPLKTGPYKDALSPFRELSEDEKSVWTGILDESFDRFVQVIADNRSSLDIDGVRKLATGQIYTAGNAQQNGLVDQIGFEDDALAHLQSQLGLESVRVISYEFPFNFLEALTASARGPEPDAALRALLDATVPRAMYVCSWLPGIQTTW